MCIAHVRDRAMLPRDAQSVQVDEAIPVPDLPTVRLAASYGTGKLLTRVSTLVDEGLLRAMQWVVDSFMIPPPEQLEELRASAEIMIEPSLQADPARFFAFSDTDPMPSEERSRSNRPLDGGAVIERELVCPYVPFTGAQDSETVHPNPDHLLVEHWIHQIDEPRATVIALHGFTMGNARFDSIMLFAKQWYERGLDVALVTLPFHGRRTPRSARFSGEHFAVPDVARLGEAVRRAIFEIRLLRNWLLARNEKPVGLLGLSLGGYLTALSASLYDDLAFAIPMVAPVCIGDLAWRFFTRSRHYQNPPVDGLHPSFDQQELRRAFRVHSPLAHRLVLPRDRVLIVAGRGDRVVPPEHPNALWPHWDEPRIHWFNGSHLAPFGRGRIVRTIDRHLRRIGIL